MRHKSWVLMIGPVAAFYLATDGHRACAENITQAWEIALNVNQLVQSRQAQSAAAEWNWKAAKSDRLPTVRTFTVNSFLTTTPEISTRSLYGTATNGGAAAGLAGLPGQPGLGFGGVPLANTGVMSGLPSAAPLLGRNQTDLPISLTFATVPLYTGGRLLRNIDAADAQIGARRNEEFRSVLDLKLTVAEAYVSVLRAQKSLDVARSNVEQLTSFTRDVKNRRQEGLAIRNEEPRRAGVAGQCPALRDPGPDGPANSLCHVQPISLPTAVGSHTTR